MKDCNVLINMGANVFDIHFILRNIENLMKLLAIKVNRVFLKEFRYVDTTLVPKCMYNNN